MMLLTSQSEIPIRIIRVKNVSQSVSVVEEDRPAVEMVGIFNLLLQFGVEWVGSAYFEMSNLEVCSHGILLSV